MPAATRRSSGRVPLKRAIVENSSEDSDTSETVNASSNRNPPTRRHRPAPAVMTQSLQPSDVATSMEVDQSQDGDRQIQIDTTEIDMMLRAKKSEDLFEYLMIENNNSLSTVRKAALKTAIGITDSKEFTAILTMTNEKLLEKSMELHEFSKDHFCLRSIVPENSGTANDAVVVDTYNKMPLALAQDLGVIYAIVTIIVQSGGSMDLSSLVLNLESIGLHKFFGDMTKAISGKWAKQGFFKIIKGSAPAASDMIGGTKVETGFRIADLIEDKSNFDKFVSDLKINASTDNPFEQADVDTDYSSEAFE